MAWLKGMHSFGTNIRKKAIWIVGLTQVYRAIKTVYMYGMHTRECALKVQFC